MKTADEALMKPKTISLTTWQDDAGALMKHPLIGVHQRSAISRGVYYR